MRHRFYVGGLPTLPSHRLAPASRLAGGLGLLLLVILVSGLPTPHAARAQDAPVLALDGGLLPAAELLLAVDEGRELLLALAQAGVVLLWSEGEAGAPGAWAWYSPDERMLYVDPSLRGAEPRTLAALLLQQGSRARARLDGTLERESAEHGRAEACATDALRATRAALRLWAVWYGPAGNPVVGHPYDAELNATLAEQAVDPASFQDRFAASTDHCAADAASAMPGR